MQFRAALLMALVLPASVHAATATQSITFDSTGQGIWHPSVDPQFLDGHFIGISDGRAGENDLWNFALPLHPVLPVYGISSGRVGLELDLNVDAGSVDTYLVYDQAGLGFSYADFADAPGAPPVRFTTIGDLGDDSSIRSYSPDLSFGADFVFEMTAGIRGGGCVNLLFTTECGSFAESFTIPKQELVLLDIGPDPSGAVQVQVLPALQEIYDNGVAFLDAGQSAVEFADDVHGAAEDFSRDWNPDGTPASPLDRVNAAVKNFIEPPSFGGVSEPLIEVGFKLPQIANIGGKAAGSNVLQTPVTSDTFLEVDVDVDGLATNALGLPVPLSFAGSVEAGIAEVGLDVTLADLTLETDFVASQQITVTPTLTMDLALQYADGSMVKTGVDQGSLSATSSLTGLDVGQDFFVDWEGSAMQGAGMKGPLLITPTYHLGVELLNDTDLGFDIGLNLEVLVGRILLEVLGIDVFNANFGPLFDATLPLAGGDLFTLPGGAFTLFQSSFTGDAITLFPATATFNGGGLNENWSEPTNWADANNNGTADPGDVGDGGNSVVIDAGIAGLIRVNNGDDFEVGNVAIGGAGTNVRVVGGTLWQAAGANSRAFLNEGQIVVSGGGRLGITAPVSGGGGPSQGAFPFLGCQGCIIVFGGQINGFTAADGTMVDGPIDLNGQFVGGVGQIHATGQFDVDANSLVQSASGTLTLNVNNDRTSINEGRISAAFTTLDWRSSNSATNFYDIDNTGGVIEAINGGTLILSHLGTSTIAAGLITISGGELRTDANPASVIEAHSRLQLDNVTSDAKIDARAQLILKNTVINNGEITAPIGVQLFDGDTTIAGDGELKLGAIGSIIMVVFPGRLTNGVGHTISGAGGIGFRTNILGFDNDGTVTATGGTLRIENQGVSPNVNRGTLEAAASGRLELSTGLYDMTAQDADMNRLSLVHARGGDVVLVGGGSRANLVNGATSGPGGVWKASGGNTIEFQDGTTLWASLANDFASLDDGDIVLEGAGSDFVIDGMSLEDTLDRIGSTGRLTLINHTFQRGGFGIPLILNESEAVFIHGRLELVNGEFITDDSNPLIPNAGFIRINTGGVVSGHGRIKSDRLENFGTIIAEGVGQTLQLDGSISNGSGSFVVTDGATLSLDLGQCGILGLGCSFTRAGSAGPELSGNGFKVESVTAPSELVLWGLENRVDVAALRNTSVELSGAGARMRMFSQSCLFLDLGCSTTGQRTLNQTLKLIDGSDLILSSGQLFNAFQHVTIANGASLELTDTVTRYTGPGLSLTSGSSVNMQGGHLTLNSLSVASDTLISGYGTLASGAITNLGSGFGVPPTGIQANDGVLEIRNSVITQNAGGFGRLEATAVDLMAAERDAPSILRLTDSTVIGGQVVVGQGAMLAGNGSFSDSVNVTNNGTIAIDTAGAGPATYSSTGLTNGSKSRTLVLGATLRLVNTEVINETSIDTVVDPDTMASMDIEHRAAIEVQSALADPGDSVLELRNTIVGGGDLRLRSEAPPDPQVPGDPRAVLRGFGTFTDVNVTVGGFSLVDANVAGRSLTFNIGTGSLTTTGDMQASNGGTLRLSGGTVAGTGDMMAADGSTVVLSNVHLDGIGFDSAGSGKVVDIADSTFTNLSNTGTFEVAATGRATLEGNVNNRVTEDDGTVRDGTIRVLSGGTVLLADGAGPTFEAMLVDDAR